MPQDQFSAASITNIGWRELRREGRNSRIDYLRRPAGYSPQPQGDLFRNAVHNFVQAILGIHILDRADLEALSEAAASLNRCEFMLTVTPLALPNATGSQVNPIAMF